MSSAHFHNFKFLSVLTTTLLFMSPNSCESSLYRISKLAIVSVVSPDLLIKLIINESAFLALRFNIDNIAFIFFVLVVSRNNNFGRCPWTKASCVPNKALYKAMVPRFEPPIPTTTIYSRFGEENLETISSIILCEIISVGKHNDASGDKKSPRSTIPHRRSRYSSNSLACSKSSFSETLPPL